jgi:hypothetical protein
MVCGILADPYQCSNHLNHVHLMKMEAECPSENSVLLSTAESGTPKKTAMKPENCSLCSKELSFVPLGEEHDESVTVRSGLPAVGQSVSGHDWRYAGPLP